MKRETFRNVSILSIWVCLLLLLLTSVPARADYKAGMIDQVKGTFNRFAEMYGKKDVKGIMSMFADDPDIVAIGLCGKQVAVGPAAVRKMFERDMSLSGATIKLPFDVVSIDSLGLTAWMAANVYPYAVLSDNKIVRGVQGSLTMVLRKIKGQWRILQLHFSVPTDDGSFVGGDKLAGKKTP